MNKIDILSLSLSELEEEIVKIGEKKFRAKQIFEWLHVKKVRSFDQMSNLSVQFRKLDLKEIFCRLKYSVRFMKRKGTAAGKFPV